MRDIAIGFLSGCVLGLLDGASATLNPAAQSMLTAIVVAATVKGALTGIGVGLAARRLDGIAAIAMAGAAIGTVLSVLAAIPTGSYVEIIPSGTTIGLLVGLIVARWGDRET